MLNNSKIIKTVSITALALMAVSGLALLWPDKEAPAAETTGEHIAATIPQQVRFSNDSAFAYTKAQCDFGPRPVNSAAHQQCLDWIAAKFRQTGCEVTLQECKDIKGYDGTPLKATNIIARLNPEATTRILVCAHYDSRPWADNDPDPANHKRPIIAANDGASGIAVMLELARCLQTDKGLNVGIDFVCFDAEDWGTPQWADNQDNAENTWALGARYFAENMPLNPIPVFGILLDMVGGQGARFYREGISTQYAPDVVERIWTAARDAGYGGYFPNQTGGMVTDDHLPLNEIAKIPTADIIPYHPDCTQSSFGPTWHTISDDINHIDPATLGAVGNTVLHVIYGLN